MAKTDQLGTSERIQEKIEKIKQFAREAPVTIIVMMELKYKARGMP